MDNDRRRFVRGETPADPDEQDIADDALLGLTEQGRALLALMDLETDGHQT